MTYGQQQYKELCSGSSKRQKKEEKRRGEETGNVRRDHDNDERQEKRGFKSRLMLRTQNGVTSLWTNNIINTISSHNAM
jgi:hypothetical protein